ncbi:hypothetical protein E4191_15845 [Paracoccus liaowanqingii]|uniref:Uncharacterized protein n=1 Tax=Paracoccus liaowanqingii TaxID=2560053 RepID=A0A4Y5SRQ4_9RHOB|nr:hypothetical protein [Paracoccus liaowanqingii]QDA35648.1 hypothetical protein E4191_15845 [Paracoccus liaowanqingii]
MRIHEPYFPPDRALFIIWCNPRFGQRHSIAAGTFEAVHAAWEAVQDHYPNDRLTWQQGARILQERGPPL